MSRIDRRAFVLACLAAPVAACQSGSSFAPASLPAAPAQPQFRNPVSLTSVGDAQVYIVTGPIPT